MSALAQRQPPTHVATEHWRNVAQATEKLNFLISLDFNSSKFEFLQSCVYSRSHKGEQGWP